MNPISERVTNVVAAGSVATGFATWADWLPVTAHGWATFVLTCLGILWMLIQMVHRFMHWNRDR